MMFNNIDKYFGGPIDWTEIDEDSAEFLFKKWGRKKVEALFESRNIEMEDDGDFESDNNSDIDF